MSQEPFAPKKEEAHATCHTGLVRAAHEISLLQVVEAVDGPARAQVPRFGGDPLVDRQLKAVFAGMTEEVGAPLRKVSLASLARKSK